jgi:asparagine synthase (glutamine-hydrolysing)
MSSVQYQLRSDVPFGVFLSGGIDSSLVTAQAVQLSGIKINTFSIGFEENKYNESAFARAVAKHLHTQHHEFIVSYKDAIQLIGDGFESYDEPNADSSIIPTMLVSKLAREHVTVSLSGEGGDELFFGYGTYQWARRLSTPVYSYLGNSTAKVLTHFSSKYQRISKMLDTSASLNKRSHIFSQEQYYFTHKEIDQLAEPEFIEAGFLAAIEDFEKITNIQDLSGKKKRNLSAMEKQALFDLQYYLPDDLLTKVDRASMRYSLETRVPFLDHRIIEFAINLSSELKYHKKIPKYILKQILYKYVPEELFNRPKQGFSIPLAKWLRNELNYLISEHLNKENIDRTGFVKSSYVQKLVKDFLAGNDYLFMRVWLLITLHKWAKDNNYPN